MDIFITYKTRIWIFKNKIKKSKIIIDKGFERSEVSDACGILKSGGEVLCPPHTCKLNTLLTKTLAQIQINKYDCA